MTEQHQAKLSPEFWGGYDIFDDQLFLEAEHVPRAHVEYKTFLRSHRALCENLGQVAAGNVTEIQYRAGNEFNANLEEGSLVILDTDSLWCAKSSDPEHTWGEGRPEDIGAPFTRPYSSLWLQGQRDYPYAPHTLGAESITFHEQKAQYTRSLKWGVIAEQDDDKYIQTFSFSVVKLLPNGTVTAPAFTKRHSGLHGNAHKTPLPIGEVRVFPQSYDSSRQIASNFMTRVRSVDVVYAAAARRQRSKGQRSLGRALLPKFGTSSI